MKPREHTTEFDLAFEELHRALSDAAYASLLSEKAEKREAAARARIAALEADKKVYAHR